MGPLGGKKVWETNHLRLQFSFGLEPWTTQPIHQEWRSHHTLNWTKIKMFVKIGWIQKGLWKSLSTQICCVKDKVRQKSSVIFWNPLKIIMSTHESNFWDTSYRSSSSSSSSSSFRCSNPTHPVLAIRARLGDLENPQWKHFTPVKLNIDPKKWCLEDSCPFKMETFSGSMFNFGGLNKRYILELIQNIWKLQVMPSTLGSAENHWGISAGCMGVGHAEDLQKKSYSYFSGIDSIVSHAPNI